MKVSTNLIGDKWLLAGDILYRFTDTGGLIYKRDAFDNIRELGSQPLAPCKVISVLLSPDKRHIELVTFEETGVRSGAVSMTLKQFKQFDKTMTEGNVPKICDFNKTYIRYMYVVRL